MFKMADQEKFIKCSCYGEGMLLTKFDGEEEIYVSFWREGINPVKLSWWMRLKLCWVALTKGNYYDDQVILSRQKSVELASWLILESGVLDKKMKMEFEEWCEKNEEELYIMFAETGMDRELDFNAEDEIEKRYEKYLKENVEQ